MKEYMPESGSETAIPKGSEIPKPKSATIDPNLDLLASFGLLTTGSKPGEYTPTPHSERGAGQREFLDVTKKAEEILHEGSILGEHPNPPSSEAIPVTSPAELTARVESGTRFAKRSRFRPHRFMKSMIAGFGKVISTGLESASHNSFTIANGINKARNAAEGTVIGTAMKAAEATLKPAQIVYAQKEAIQEALASGLYNGGTVIRNSFENGPKLFVKTAAGAMLEVRDAGTEVKAARADEAPEGLELDDFSRYVKKQILDIEDGGSMLTADFVFAKARSLETYDIVDQRNSPKGKWMSRARQLPLGIGTTMFGPEPPILDPLFVKEEKDKLVNEFKFRLFLAVAQGHVQNGNQDEFIALMGNYIGKDGLEYVSLKLESKEPEQFQITKTIDWLESAKIDAAGNVSFDPNNRSGDYFRIEKSEDKDKIKKQIEANIRREIKREMGLKLQPTTESTPPDPNDPITRDINKRVETSFKIANRLLDVTGMSTFFGGAVDASGELIKLRAAKELERDGLFNAGRVNLNKPEFHRKVAQIRAQDGVRVLPQTILGVDENGDPFNLGPSTQYLFKGVFNAPEVMRDKIDDRFAVELLPYLDSRIENFCYYRGYQSLTETLRDMRTSGVDPATGNPILGDSLQSNKMAPSDMYGWASSIKKGAAFQEAIGEYIVNPFKDPNAANENVNKKVIADVMEPYIKLVQKAAYMQSIYPPQEQDDLRRRQEGNLYFNEEMLEVSIRYHDSAVGKGKHSWNRWNDMVKSSILKDMVGNYLIRKATVPDLMNGTETSATFAGLWNAWLEIREGLYSARNKGVSFGLRVLANSFGEEIAN